MYCKVVDLPCFFGFLTSTTFARKKRSNFHHFIGFIECFYLNLLPILIAPFKELKLKEMKKVMKLNKILIAPFKELKPSHGGIIEELPADINRTI